MLEAPGVPACAGDGGSVADVRLVGVHAAPTIDALAAVVSGGAGLDAVGLDIPIGLPDTGRRLADGLARARVGPRASSVFGVPVRAALLAADHAEAVRRQRAATGEGVSRQSHALAAKILEVDAWARTCGLDVVEVHPEVVFAELAGAPVLARKKSWAGAAQRHALLRTAGVELSGDLGAAGRIAAVDDVLDAAAVAWTALRRARGLATSLPDPPEHFADGWPAAIWV